MISQLLSTRKANHKIIRNFPDEGKGGPGVVFQHTLLGKHDGGFFRSLWNVNIAVLCRWRRYASLGSCDVVNLSAVWQFSQGYRWIFDNTQSRSPHESQKSSQIDGTWWWIHPRLHTKSSRLNFQLGDHDKQYRVTWWRTKNLGHEFLNLVSTRFDESKCAKNKRLGGSVSAHFWNLRSGRWKFLISQSIRLSFSSLSANEIVHSKVLRSFFVYVNVYYNCFPSIKAPSTIS